ncbi:MAG: hypothetical protein ACK5P5_06600 [Pseudobdellovibrionaceae bacterium]
MKAIDQVYNLMSQAQEKIWKVGENLNIDQIQNDLEKLRKQLQQQGQKKIDNARSNTVSTLNKLQKEYNSVFKKVERAQAQAKKDVALVKKNVVKHLADLEKQMGSVRKNLEAKKGQFEKLFMGKAKSVKKTTKTVAKKTARKKAVRETIKK